MNPKIEKLKAERSRNTEKISDLQNRNRKLSEQITKLENNDIIGMVREIGMTPEQLAALLSGKAADLPGTDEYEETEGYEHENYKDASQGADRISGSACHDDGAGGSCLCLRR